jgi:hypothetical protein
MDIISNNNLIHSLLLAVNQPCSNQIINDRQYPNSDEISINQMFQTPSIRNFIIFKRSSTTLQQAYKRHEVI